MAKSATVLVSDLRRVLQSELKIGQSLLALVDSEAQLLIANNAVALAALEAEQQACMAKQNALGAERQAIVGELAARFAIPVPRTLTDLLAHLDDRDARSLQTLRARLLAVHTTLANRNAQNRCLLDNALDYVRFSLDALTDAALKPARYGTNLAALAAPTFYLDNKA